MAESASHNDQIPTDPLHALLIILAILWAASRLSPDQAQALAGAGCAAELVLYALRLMHRRE